MSQALQAVSSISGTITQPSEIFAVANGVDDTYGLTVGGFPATRIDSVSAVHRTDWQGRQLLYSTARNNQMPYSEDISHWPASAAYTKTATTDQFHSTGPVYWEYARLTSTASSPISINTFATLTADTVVSWTIALRASTPFPANRVDIGIYDNQGTGFGDVGPTTYEILEGPANYQTRSGGRLRFGNLSTTEDSLILITRAMTAGQQARPIFYINTVDGTAAIGDAVRVARAMVSYNGPAEQGAYILTAGAPVTVTDYTLSGTSIVFGEVPVAGAVLDWDGEGKSLVSGPELTYIGGAGAAIQAPEELAITDADAHLPVPIIVGDTIDHNAFGDSPTTDFYYKIWVFPPRTEIRNPPLNTNLPFRIWNAYPSPANNTLIAIIATDDDGVSLDIAPGAQWSALETKQINLQLSSTAGAEVDAKFEFDFTVGKGLYEFVASLFSSLELVPENDVTETWEWRTDIRKAWSQAEQRASIRSIGPRRLIEFGVVFTSDDDIRMQNAKLATQLAGTVQVPYYQYSAYINQTADVGADTVFFDAAQTDLREGETVVVMSREGEITPYDILSLTPTSATFNRQIATPIAKGSIIVPQFPSIATGNITQQRYLRNASSVKFSFRADSPRVSLVRPGTEIELTTFNDIPVLDMHPLVDGTISDEYDAGLQVSDSGVGIAHRYQSWKHYETSMPREFLVRRRLKPEEMDWWRLFGETIDGSRVRFYMPTWRADVLLVGDQPVEGASSFVVKGSDYSSEYFPYETYKQLSFTQPDGTLWYASVIQVTSNFDGNGNDQIQIDRPFTAASAAFTQVGFLLGCRLEDDKFVFQHKYLDSVVSINVRSADR